VYGLDVRAAARQITARGGADIAISLPVAFLSATAVVSTRQLRRQPPTPRQQGELAGRRLALPPSAIAREHACEIFHP